MTDVMRFRPSRAALLVRVSPLLVLTAMAVGDRVVAPVSPRHGGFPLPVAAVLGLVVAGWWRDSTVMTADGIVTARWWSRRAIPWSQVQAVEIVPDAGPRGVQVITGDGARVRLRVPTVTRWNLARLERDVDTIRRWWWTYRGPGWQPMARNPWSRVALAVDDPWRTTALAGTAATPVSGGRRPDGAEG